MLSVLLDWFNYTQPTIPSLSPLHTTSTSFTFSGQGVAGQGGAGQGGADNEGISSSKDASRVRLEHCFRLVS